MDKCCLFWCLFSEYVVINYRFEYGFYFLLDGGGVVGLRVMWLLVVRVMWLLVVRLLTI